MKKLIVFLLPVIILSCKKESTAALEISDSTAKTELPPPSQQVDSSVIKLNDSTNLSVDNLENKSARREQERVIIRMENGANLPLNISEKFDKTHDKLILKISNYTKPSINAKITTENQDFNIRFNQIKLPDGTMDGPFSRDLKYAVKTDGELWLIIGKNNMADGKTEGQFTVRVE